MTGYDAETHRFAEALLSAFLTEGTQRAEPPILLPAHELLDLYGEEMRARAYVTDDPLKGEQMLRPDFTMALAGEHLSGPDAQLHQRYGYAGRVFRKQENDPDKTNEFLQVGLEIFNAPDLQASEARLFKEVSRMVSDADLKPAIGDIGILRAAIDGLSTSKRRRSALMRHLWRPARFRGLLERYAGKSTPSKTRGELLAKGLDALPPEVRGLRSREEIAARISWLQEDAQLPPIQKTEVEQLEQLMCIHCSADQAEKELSELRSEIPALSQPFEQFCSRLEALDREGVSLSDITFEASYGRTSMEYYDGFVFGFYSETRPELSPVASGGRYDALLAKLGAKAGQTAMGAMIRPDLLQALSHLSDDSAGDLK